MKILLDTNAYTALFRGQQSTLTIVMNASQVYFSTIVMGELKAGFRGGKRRQHNEQALAQFLQAPQVEAVAVYAYTSDIYADIKHALKRSGTPIPVNDVWIAAQAIEMGATLITADKHFQHVQGLRTQQP